MKDSKLLKPKEFDAEKHKKIISQLHPHMDFKEFEEICCPISKDILENYEGFEKVKKGPQFTGTPLKVKGDVGSKTIYEGACSCRNCLAFLEAVNEMLCWRHG